MSVWPQIALKDCARVVGGATPKSSVEEYWNGDVLWTTPKDLSDLDSKYLDDTPRKITADGLKSCAAELLPANSVLFSSRAPIGHVAINSVPMATNQGFKSMVPGSDLDPSYLYWWLKCHRAKLEMLGNGATFKEVSKSVVERVEIPLPPLDEQKRIAAILDQADELRRKRQRAIDRLGQLGQAIFHHMFGDPSAPSEREACNLIEIADLINGDRSSNYPSGNDIKDEGILFLNTTNINGGELDLSKAQFITEQKFASLSRGKLRKDDLVITLRGTLGQCALFDCDYETGFINAQMMIIRAKDSVLPRFLREYISFPSVQAKLKRSNTGSAVPQLTATQMKEMPILLPDLPDQRKFVEAVHAIRSAYKGTKSHLAKLDDLFGSLQNRAFKGEL